MPAPPHASAAILAVGDELARGESPDSNSRWLSHQLTGLAIRVAEHALVPDDLKTISRTMRRLRLHGAYDGQSEVTVIVNNVELPADVDGETWSKTISGLYSHIS